MIAFKSMGAMKTAMSWMNLRQLPVRKLRPKLTTNGRNIERFSLARRLRFGSTFTSPPPVAEKLLRTKIRRMEKRKDYEQPCFRRLSGSEISSLHHRLPILVEDRRNRCTLVPWVQLPEVGGGEGPLVTC